MTLNLTTLEKKALSKLIIDIANADNIVTDEEVEYLLKLQGLIGISGPELAEAKTMSVMLALFLISTIAPVDKEAVMYILVQMILADGEVKNSELEIFQFFCSVANLPIENIKSFKGE